MTPEGRATVQRGRRLATVALWLAGALLLAGCGGKRVQADQSQQQQQALERARDLCRAFGYTPGTTEFARCAQSEYDRGWQAPSQAAVPQVVVPPPVVVPAPAPQAQPQPAQQPVQPQSAAQGSQPQPTGAVHPQSAVQAQSAAQASQPQPTPPSDSGGDDWFINWFKRPNVCQQAACSAY